MRSCQDINTKCKLGCIKIGENKYKIGFFTENDNIEKIVKNREYY